MCGRSMANTSSKFDWYLMDVAAVTASPATVAEYWATVELDLSSPVIELVSGTNCFAWGFPDRLGNGTS